MATFAPYSAKRTAIAWPIPEVPPVTRTFLPFSPRMAAVAASGAVAVMAPPRALESVGRGSESRSVGDRYRPVAPAQDREGEKREEEYGEQPGGDQRGPGGLVDDAEVHPDHGGGDHERQRRRLQEPGH